MNPEAIKVGDKINIEAIVIRKLHSEEQLITCELPTGLQFHVFQRDFEALSPSNGTKNAETSPKYDPCRPFKAGDIVEPCQVKGRWQSPAWEGRSGILITVMSDEEEDGTMWVKDPDCREEDCVDAVYFQLVAPVEELEPYCVHDNEYSKSVEVRSGNPGRVCSAYYWGGESPAYTKTQARAAAQTECDRLNKQYQEEYEQAKSHE